MISVVIPARNAAATIARQLAAVGSQLTSEEAEIVVADNRSADGTTAVAATLGARVVSAHDRASPGYARNFGAAATTGTLLLFCDADDEVCGGWVQAHVKALGQLDVSVGPAVGVDPAQPLMSVHGFRPGGGAGNLALRRTVFDALGGFDASLQAGEDLDLCWRANEAGFKIGFCPDARVRVASRATARLALRQGFRNGQADVELFLRHRSSGMRRRPGRHVARSLLGLGRRLPQLRNVDGRVEWAVHLGGQMGRFFGSARRRTLYL